MPRYRLTEEEHEELEEAEKLRLTADFFRRLYGRERGDRYLRMYELLPPEN